MPKTKEFDDKKVMGNADSHKETTVIIVGFLKLFNSLIIVEYCPLSGKD